VRRRRFLDGLADQVAERDARRDRKRREQADWDRRWEARNRQGQAGGARGRARGGGGDPMRDGDGNVVASLSELRLNGGYRITDSGLVEAPVGAQSPKREQQRRQAAVLARQVAEKRDRQAAAAAAQDARDGGGGGGNGGGGRRWRRGRRVVPAPAPPRLQLPPRGPEAADAGAGAEGGGGDANADLSARAPYQRSAYALSPRPYRVDSRADLIASQRSEQPTQPTQQQQQQQPQPPGAAGRADGSPLRAVWGGMTAGAGDGGGYDPNEDSIKPNRSFFSPVKSAARRFDFADEGAGAGAAAPPARGNSRGPVDETALLLEFLQHSATDALEHAYGYGGGAP
jgi:hypothetical protein